MTEVCADDGDEPPPLVDDDEDPHMPFADDSDTDHAYDGESSRFSPPRQEATLCRRSLVVTPREMTFRGRPQCDEDQELETSKRRNKLSHSRTVPSKNHQKADLIRQGPAEQSSVKYSHGSRTPGPETPPAASSSQSIPHLIPRTKSPVAILASPEEIASQPASRSPRVVPKSLNKKRKAVDVGAKRQRKRRKIVQDVDGSMMVEAQGVWAVNLWNECHHRVAEMGTLSQLSTNIRFRGSFSRRR